MPFSFYPGFKVKSTVLKIVPGLCEFLTHAARPTASQKYDCLLAIYTCIKFNYQTRIVRVGSPATEQQPDFNGDNFTVSWNLREI